MSFDFNKSGIWHPKQKNNQLGALGTGSREQAPGPAPASGGGQDPLTAAAQGYAINKGTALADAGISKGWAALTQPAAGTATATAPAGFTLGAPATAGTSAFGSAVAPTAGTTLGSVVAPAGATSALGGATLGTGASAGLASGGAALGAGASTAAVGTAATGGLTAATPALAAMGPVGWGVLGLGALYGAHKAGLFNDGTTSVPNAEQLQTHPQSAPLATPMVTPMVAQEAPVVAAPLMQSYVDYRPANFTPAEQTEQQDPKMLIQKALGGK